jgi:hypothetical protein
MSHECHCADEITREPSDVQRTRSGYCCVAALHDRTNSKAQHCLPVTDCARQQPTIERIFALHHRTESRRVTKKRYSPLCRACGRSSSSCPHSDSTGESLPIRISFAISTVNASTFGEFTFGRSSRTASALLPPSTAVPYSAAGPWHRLAKGLNYTRVAAAVSGTACQGPAGSCRAREQPS